MSLTYKVYPFSFTIFFFFAPITKTVCPRVILPEKILPKPKVLIYPYPFNSFKPLSFKLFLGMFTILEINMIKGSYWLVEHLDIALIIDGFNSYLEEFSFKR